MEPTKISSPQGAQSTHATRHRSTAQAADANDAGTGGFMALLAALGDGTPGEGEGTLASLDLAASGATPIDAGSSDATKAALDASATAAWQGLLTSGVVPPDQRVAAEGSQAAVGFGAPGGAALGLGNVMVGAEGLSAGIVAETAMLDASADLRGGAPAVGGTAQSRILSRMQSVLAQKSDAFDLSAGRSVGGGTSQQLSAHPGVATALSQMVGERPLVAGALAGVSERVVTGALDSAGGDGMASFAEGMLSSLASPRNGDGAGSGGRAGGGRSDAEGWFDGSGGSVSVEPGSLDGATVFADPAQAGAEEQVAEQVAYWVNQKTQNAELTLNGDGQPVEVSVSLSGNEAHVAFRSDQPQTREMLDRSMAQLSDLLRGEGLVLSGMSVSTSAGQRQNAGGAEQQAPRDGARQAKVVAAAPVGTASPLRGGASDRAVDVFV